MGEQRLRVLRQSLKRCCTRSSWLAGTDIVLIGCPPSTVEWTADDTNSISKIHAALPKGHHKKAVANGAHLSLRFASSCRRDQTAMQRPSSKARARTIARIEPST